MKEKKNSRPVQRLLCFMLAVVLCTMAGISLSAEGLYTPPEEPRAQAVYMVNEDTGLVVYAKNAEAKMYPASMTKVMSAIIILENVQDLDNTKATMTIDLMNILAGTGSSNIGLVAGEEMTMRQLLYGMLLASGNDAALLAARTVSGSVEAFVEKMNAKAAELGCVNTHFVNPHGLHDENHYTTAHDMYRITAYAMKNPIFSEIVGTQQYKVPATNKKPERLLVSTNVMLSRNLGGSLYYEPIRGIKTGRTTPAGPCFVSRAVKDGYTYTMVVMKADLPDAEGNPATGTTSFAVTKQLYQWAFSNLTLQELIKQEAVLKTVPVKYATAVDAVGVTPDKTFISLIPKTADASSIVVEYTLPSELEAPVQKGQVVGSAVVKIAGQELGKLTLVANEDIDRNIILFFFSKAADFIGEHIIVILVIVILVPLMFWMISQAIRRRKRIKRGLGGGKTRSRRKKVYRGRRRRY